jgi:hypothetical protein
MSKVNCILAWQLHVYDVFFAGILAFYADE